jgi:anti-anti-sigma regulatory factor
MEGTFDRSTTPATLRLEGNLEIGSAAELQSRLLEALAVGEPIRIVLEGVTGLDVTGLQLLTAAERAAQARGAAWVRSGAMPERLKRTADEAGWERVPFAGDAA